MAKHIFEFTVEHPDLPKNEYGLHQVETTVSSDELEDVDFLPGDYDGFVEALREAALQVRKNVAGGHLVDYDSFGNDSAYLDRIDEVVEEITIVSAGLQGPAIRYLAEGKYPGREGNLWSEHVEGVCEAEAIYQARDIMASNMEWDEDFFKRIDKLDEIYVEVSPAPASKDEFRSALHKLAVAAIESGMTGEEIEGAVEVLRNDGVDIEMPAAGPRA